MSHKHQVVGSSPTMSIRQYMASWSDCLKARWLERLTLSSSVLVSGVIKMYELATLFLVTYVFWFLSICLLFFFLILDLVTYNDYFDKTMVMFFIAMLLGVLLLLLGLTGTIIS